MIKRKLLGVMAGAGILLAGLVGSGAMIATGPTQGPRAPQEHVWPVTTMKVNVADLAPSVPLFGRVESRRESSITAAVEANIERVHVREGQYVAAGDLLVSLNDTEAVLALQQSEADLLEAETTLAILKVQGVTDIRVLEHQEDIGALIRNKVARQSKLRTNRSVSKSDYDTTRLEAKEQAILLERQRAAVANHGNQLALADARIKKARARLRQARLNLARTKVLAPFDCVISEVDASVGDRVQAGKRLLSLYDRSALEIRVGIPSHHVKTLRSALERRSEVKAEAAVLGEKVPLRLSQLAASVTPGRSGIDGFFQVLDHADALALGQVVKLSAVLPVEKDVIAVPPAAIYNDLIYVVENDRLRSIGVRRVGDSNRGGEHRVLVRADDALDTVELLITKVHHAKSGLKVNVINKDS